MMVVVLVNSLLGVLFIKVNVLLFRFVGKQIYFKKINKNNQQKISKKNKIIINKQNVKLIIV